ncbi:hypothetical protein ACFYXH_07960 [Streptomyces sp. NPDC002730]|uniref:hypothetical protein n=1 Tax=Streptomyces sp. NPDC002730 TaxID=3364662 RepID=UPI0036BF3955
MIIDPRKGTAAVLTDPGPGAGGIRSRSRHDYIFGDTTTVGAWSVDTGQFPTYENP